MLRQVKDSLLRSIGANNKHKSDLPIGSFRRPSSFRNNNDNNTNDGSAASIRTPSAIQKTWDRTEVPVRITYICIIIGIIMIWYGWRYISYYSAGLHMECHSIACDITIYPIGLYKRKIQLYNVPKQQLVNVQGVKSHKNGTFITDQNIVLLDRYDHRNKQKHNYKKSSYKGPDSNGHYLTYAILLQDKDTNDRNSRRIEMIDTDKAAGDATTTIPEVDLQPIRSFLQPINSNDDNDNNNNEQHQSQQRYRLVLRIFGVRHSQRRVRTMVTKIESYIKHHRQKLMIIEHSSPAWQGIILIVLGTVTILITCTLGQFTNDTQYYNHYGSGSKNNNNNTIRGPGRREILLQKHNPSPSLLNEKRKVTLSSIHQVSIPSQYEVNTSTTATSSSNNNNSNKKSSSSIAPIAQNQQRSSRPSSSTTNMSANNNNVSYRKAVASAHARTHAY